jgi:hypothetical protein
MAIHRYIIESKPPTKINSSSGFDAGIKLVRVAKNSTILFRERETKYQSKEKQKVSGINKSSFECVNKNGLNRYRHTYQKGIKQDNEIMKFFIRGDNEFKSAMNPIT